MLATQSSHHNHHIPSHAIACHRMPSHAIACHHMSSRSMPSHTITCLIAYHRMPSHAIAYRRMPLIACQRACAVKRAPRLAPVAPPQGRPGGAFGLHREHWPWAPCANGPAGPKRQGVFVLLQLYVRPEIRTPQKHRISAGNRGGAALGCCNMK